MFGLSKDEWRALALSVKLHPQDRKLSPVDVARKLQLALENGTKEELAKSLGYEEPSTLIKISRLAELPDEAASLVAWGGTGAGTVSMSVAAELMRLPSLEIVVSSIKAAIALSITRDEARQITQVQQRSGLGIEECIETVLLTRPIIERKELILGMLTTPEAVEKVRRLGKERASKKLKIALARNFPETVIQSVKVNSPRFSLLIAEDQAADLRDSLGGESLEDMTTRLVENLSAT